MPEQYLIDLSGRRIKMVCKNCEHCKPSYKAYQCDLAKKRTRLQDTCAEWRQK